jgi:hypothetical protein
LEEWDSKVSFVIQDVPLPEVKERAPLVRVGSDDFFHWEHFAIIRRLSSFTFFRTEEASRRLESSTEDEEIEPESESGRCKGRKRGGAEEGVSFVDVVLEKNVKEERLQPS